MPAVAVVVLAIAIVVLILLWRWVDGLALIDVEKRATAHLDVIKTASGIAVGGGGLFALYLAARRQRTQESELEVRLDELRNRQVELEQRDRTQRHTEEVAEMNRRHAEQVAADSRHDAAERRATEIYTKAAEQFGSDNIAVQLAGLYGFERLANDQPQLRQTVVDVICAFLRMPRSQDADDAITVRRNSQVRSAAQRILVEHLRRSVEPTTGTFWDVNLDLSEATLENFDLVGCRVGKAVFAKTTFVGSCNFTRLHTVGELDLSGATFDCPLVATTVRVGGDLLLDRAVFRKEVDLREADIVGGSVLTGCSFNADATFRGCEFGGDVHCVDAHFSRAALFAAAKFRRSVTVESTAFDGEVNFRSADFFGTTRFSSTTFAEEAWFVKAEFSTTPLFSEVAFLGDAWMHSIGLRNGILFQDVAFSGAADLSDCENAVARDVRAKRVPLYREWPATWRVEETTGSGEGDWESLVDDAGPDRLEFPDVLWNFAQD